MSRHRDRQIATLINDINRHNLTQYQARIAHMAAINATGRADHDGYPATTPGNGNPGAGKGGGRTLTIPDEHGQPDHVPTTSTEAAALARLDGTRGHGGPDPIDRMYRDTIRALEQAVSGLNTVRNNILAFDNLRTTSELTDPPQCYVASVIYQLPYDPIWEPHVTTDFAGYLNPPWDERRKVCRGVYDFTRRPQAGTWAHRIPSRDEMIHYLRNGTFRILEPPSTHTRVS